MAWGGVVALYRGLFRVPYVINGNDSWLGTIEARNPDGTGNNLGRTDQGSALTPYVRVTANSYRDGVGAAWDLPVQEARGRNAADLVGAAPQPREITSRVMAQPTDANGADIDLPNAAGVNEYFQFFGQFLTHDVAEAANDSASRALFLDGIPFSFRRTPFELGSDEHNANVRQQLNTKTSYLDLSQVYGPNQASENLLRARDAGAPGGRSAELLLGEDGMLPTYQEVADDKGVTLASVTRVLEPGASGSMFATGDDRANQQTPLLTHHTIWTRNHNWHVEQLRKAFPSWGEEKLFEAARALNEADWQSVIYDEYVPKLIGEKALSTYSGYKSRVDASVINEWTTVAFRFGHDQSSNDLGLLGENGSLIQTLTLAEAFLTGADGLRDDAALSNWMRGELARATQEIDGKIVSGNRNLLFGNPNVVDLSVLDIQRGRDHGVGRLNKLRDGLGLETYDSFDDFGRKNGVDDATVAALKDIYDNRINTLDSIVGGLLERHVADSMLGETFTVLNVLQFEALRDGDRFFYLNRLSPELIEKVRSVSLADIIERTTDVDHIYRDAFLAHDRVGGTRGSETLRGSSGRDLMIGFTGWDRLHGGSGDDDLYGDAGRDSLRGGNGKDILHGGSDADLLDGGRGDDLIFGDTGADRIFGGTGADQIQGGGGADEIHGGGGDDVIAGGGGDDDLWGDGGRDVFVFAARGGQDVVHDFRAEDQLDLSAFGFASIRDVRDASHRSGHDTIIALDAGNSITLEDVSWTLHSRHVVFDI